MVCTPLVYGTDAQGEHSSSREVKKDRAMPLQDRLKTFGHFLDGECCLHMQTRAMDLHKERPYSCCSAEGSGSCRGTVRGPGHRPPSPWRLPARGKAEAGGRAPVGLVDSVEFREGFPFDLAKEKSSLFPPATGLAGPEAAGAGFPSLL